MRTLTLLAGLLLVLAPLGRAAVPVPQESDGWTRLFGIRTPKRSAGELREALHDQAARDPRPLVACLVQGGHGPGDLWGSPTLRLRQVEEVLVDHDGPRLGAALAQELRGASPSPRPWVLRFLGRLRSPGTLGLLFEEADRLGPGIRRGSPRRAFEAALEERITASVRGFEELARVLEGRGPGTLEVLASLLGSFEGPPLRHVLDVLVRVDLPRADVHLERALELERGYPWLFDDGNRIALANLAASPDWRRRRRAAELATVAPAAESLWLLLGLLDDAHESVRGAALTGLRRRTGRWEDERKSSWIALLEEPLAGFPSWLEERRDDLASPALGTAFRAVRDVASQSHHRHEAARALAASLRSQPVLSAVGTTSILSRLGSRAAVPGLVESLGAEDPRLAKAAHQALVELAGEDRGTRPADWASFLAGELE